MSRLRFPNFTGNTSSFYYSLEIVICKNKPSGSSVRCERSFRLNVYLFERQPVQQPLCTPTRTVLLYCNSQWLHLGQDIAESVNKNKDRHGEPRTGLHVMSVETGTNIKPMLSVQEVFHKTFD